MNKSYEKIVLIIAVLAAAGLAFMGFTKLSAVAQDFVSESVSGGKNDTAVAGADKLAATMESMAKPALLSLKVYLKVLRVSNGLLHCCPGDRAQARRVGARGVT